MGGIIGEENMIFFRDFHLIVQTLSYFRAGEKSFMPMQNDYDIQLFVKELLLKQGNRRSYIFQSDYSKNFSMSIEHSEMNDIQKTIFVHRLGGYKNNRLDMEAVI